MKYFFVCILNVFFALTSSKAFAWGSATGFETHQFIDRMAYEQLSKDPTLVGSGFPKLDDIIGHEGVYYLGDGESIWSPAYVGGPGPDRPGVSDDSDHYYNPLTGRGTAPAAVAKNYRYIAKGISGGGAAEEAVKKSAAWGAHYIADMSVPYHVVGMTKADLLVLYASFGGATGGRVNMPANVAGPRNYLSYHLPATHTEDFKKEVERYLAQAMLPENAHMNWFDPWYWNGMASQTKGSSHIEWEMAVSHSVVYNLSGYSPDWKNAAATFTDPWDAQATQAEIIAKSAAHMTSGATSAWVYDASEPLKRSIQDVLTLWRASISALRPDLSFELDTSDDSASVDAPVFVLKGKVQNVTAEDTANDVQMRISILSGGSFVDGDENPVSIASISPSGKQEGGEWKIQVTDTKNGAKVKVETIASYAAVPDLQYAFKIVTVKAAELDGRYTGRFTGTDGASGSISFTVNQGTVTGSISGVYDESPTDGTFEGTVDAGGTLTTTLRGIIHATGFNGDPWDIPFSGEILGHIDGLAGSGQWTGRNSWATPHGDWTVQKVR